MGGAGCAGVCCAGAARLVPGSVMPASVAENSARDTQYCSRFLLRMLVPPVEASANGQAARPEAASLDEFAIHSTHRLIPESPLAGGARTLEPAGTDSLASRGHAALREGQQRGPAARGPGAG